MPRSWSLDSLSLSLFRAARPMETHDKHESGSEVASENLSSLDDRLHSLLDRLEAESAFEFVSRVFKYGFQAKSQHRETMLILYTL